MTNSTVPTKKLHITWTTVLLTVVALGAAIAVLVFLFPRLSFWFSLYFGYTELKSLLYQHLGFSDAISSFLATVLSPLYAIAWIPLFYLSYGLFQRHFDLKRVSLALGAYLLIYGTPPLAEAFLGQDICFNQATGAPQKWYVVHEGKIILFDSGGYDSFGVQKIPVTSQVCEGYVLQESGGGQNILQQGPKQLEFFDPNSGKAQAWYDRDTRGNLKFFVAPGFDPQTGTSG